MAIHNFGKKNLSCSNAEEGFTGDNRNALRKKSRVYFAIAAEHAITAGAGEKPYAYALARVHPCTSGPRASIRPTTS
jgi:hypothetical protein